MKKIRVGIVNYLNTAPLIYGIKNSAVSADIELVPDYPANLAKDLVDNKIDIGLVPVAVLPELPQWWLVGDYCIGCDGPVSSVCIFSDLPIENTRRILLDYQSRTSTELARVLVRDFWQLNVEFIDATGDDFQQQIKGDTAGLVIGDRSFAQRKTSKYSYDLGEAWKMHTGLPFVFAAWISNKPLDKDFISAFNSANKHGVENIADVLPGLNYNGSVNLGEYFSKYISYTLDDEKRRALRKFLNYFHKDVIV
ncbi:MAG: menaquinone biosynthesis protein [Chitinophagaceae bacterium]|nr:menaquinone biosynthesis protein [Chitinophagaceae bacterium]